MDRVVRGIAWTGKRYPAILAPIILILSLAVLWGVAACVEAQVRLLTLLVQWLAGWGAAS